MTDWYSALAQELLMVEPIHTGEVHAQNTSASPQHATHELVDVRLTFEVPHQNDVWQKLVEPNLPWADEHFAERTSGAPLNPAPSHERWPFAQKSNAQHTDDSGKFSHTYPERFWPRFAGEEWRMQDRVPSVGIRYQYGDLADVVALLVRNPLTRQAYLPVWFPEDLTAAHLGKRVPCTIGYHFMMREGQLNCWYTMRSCDFVRYLRDDVYMAGRLMQWVCDQVNLTGRLNDTFVPGNLHIGISSLHAFVGDAWVLRRVVKSGA